MAASPVTSLPAVDRITALKDYYTCTYAHTHTQSNKQRTQRLRLSTGHREYRSTGTYCIWSWDLALLVSDNRSAANWTLGFSSSLCFFLLLNHSIFPAAHVTSFSCFCGIYIFLGNQPVVLEPAAPDRKKEGGRDREDVGVKGKRHIVRQKRSMIAGQT